MQVIAFAIDGQNCIVPGSNADCLIDVRLLCLTDLSLLCQDITIYLIRARQVLCLFEAPAGCQNVSATAVPAAGTMHMLNLPTIVSHCHAIVRFHYRNTHWIEKFT